MLSEEWRWRLAAIWVIFFTAISAYALFQVHAVADDNRDALCSIRTDRVKLYSALGDLADVKGQPDVGKILSDATDGERSALAALGCG